MTNAEKFKTIFGLYATELWVMDEERMLKWLNAECKEPERKTGQWLDGHRAGYGESLYWYIYCSECLCERDDDDHDKDTPFCPMCGVRMMEGKQE